MDARRFKRIFCKFFNLDMVKKNNLIDNKIIQDTINNHMNYSQNNEYKICHYLYFFQWYENQ